jgi:molybdopterin biosynthesis enzyme
VFVATPLTSQSSGALTSMRNANGLAVIDEGTSATDEANVLLLAL